MNSSTQELVAQAIQVERVRSGFKSNAALARKIGVSPTWLSKRLIGDIRMDLDDVDAIAQALGKKPFDLISEARAERSLAA